MVEQLLAVYGLPDRAFNARLTPALDSTRPPMENRLKSNVD
jgi:hypothetical protein